MPPIKTFGERIADALVEDGLLTPQQVAELLELQRKDGARLVKLIQDRGYVSETDLVVSMGRVLNVPPVNLARLQIPLDVAEIIPRDLAQNHKVIPIARLDSKLFVAMADPLNVLALDDLKRTTKLEVHPLIAPERAILDKLSSLDAAKSGSIEQFIQDTQKAEAEAEADQVEVTRDAVEEVNLDQLAASSEEAPVIKLANLILVQGIKERASDIHLEPFEKTVRLRYRIDGVLHDVTPPPKSMYLPLVSRFKIMSNLDIAERRLPQDGRMRVRVGGRDYDLRVSILPTVHGEKVVLRVLDKSNLSGSLDQLGLDEDTYRRFKAAIDAPHGLILVTGPTGSGKTTTLYSALNELNSPIYNIITVEDPVEFQIPGINQVPVRKEIGLTFANALRSILRQDPDIIMIGEIRDAETAEIAIEAALTGHQVLSTMHCNDAAGAITRLDEMGIAPFLISSSVILSCAQRLMRKICSHCKEPVSYPPKMFQDLNIDPALFDGVTLYRGRGCERCRNSGYSGRMAIIEAMTVTDEIRKLIIARANSHEISQVAIQQGMKTLRMVALERARQGLSTLEQVLVLTMSH
ncbi:Flp pilus assembly complex ATPase component TadA [Limisphaera ngatamarikiensis]|uniref:Flp pilus assembly complex ATPase component TadA n=1 Tax=Limisphaera ngatamarikiensis TaxID=1324935 RepID=A0A6M1RTR7_9BACT|nr:ATPase, T2SS/T4P/T4SS family [Limisphaera ngatamarikiensis]NGO38794.1 Flp pilus assembly complex ATPase component TadA [Limisphaera ngatamarikiensis]